MNELPVTEVIFKHDSRVPVVQLSANPCRFAAQIKNRKHLRLISSFTVVNAKRKLLREHPIETKVQSVNAAERCEPFNILDNASENIISNTLLYLIVEITCGLDVFCRFLQDNDSFYD